MHANGRQFDLPSDIKKDVTEGAISCTTAAWNCRGNKEKEHFLSSFGSCEKINTTRVHESHRFFLCVLRSCSDLQNGSDGHSPTRALHARAMCSCFVNNKHNFLISLSSLSCVLRQIRMVKRLLLILLSCLVGSPAKARYETAVGGWARILSVLGVMERGFDSVAAQCHQRCPRCCLALVGWFSFHAA